MRAVVRQVAVPSEPTEDALHGKPDNSPLGMKSWNKTLQT